MTTASKAPVRLELVSDPMFLAGAREMVSSVAGRLGFGDTACGQIALAVDEALCNVIRHGYEGQGGRPIWIELWPIESGEGLRIVIEDEAKQIDPDAVRGRDLDDIKPGGLGVHIMREIMDSVVFERRDGVGMRLTLTKRRSAAHGGGPG